MLKYIQKIKSTIRTVHTTDKKVAILQNDLIDLRKSILDMQSQILQNQVSNQKVVKDQLAKLNSASYSKSEYFEINEELGVFTVKPFRNYFLALEQEGKLESSLHLLKKGTDRKSHEAIDLFVKRVMFDLPQSLPGGTPILYRMDKLFSEDELYPYSSGETAKKTREFRSRYDIGKLKTFLCPIYYESGLVFLDEGILERIKGSIAIDAGAYWGDTALIFSEYEPKNVLAFEPVEHWFNTMCGVVDRNKLSDVILPIKMGISNECGTLYYEERDTTSTLSVDENSNECEVTTIDRYIEDNFSEQRVGLIKYDVEGADFDALIGSKSVIERDKPILLTSIYHSPEHFFEIKNYIDSLGLNYQHKIRKLAKSPLCDLMLISWVE